MPTRKIVYPDADEYDKKFFSGERLKRLNQLGNFEIHYGCPANLKQLTERIGDASGVLLEQ